MLLTLDQFCTRYQGTKVDFDGFAGAQCVDLFRQYCNDVWGIPHTGALGKDGGAKDLYLNYDLMPLEVRYLIKMPYPVSTGDVVVFGPNRNNKYGHVGIYIATVGDKVLVFEQDGFKQDGAKYNWRDVADVLGALRKRYV